MLICLKFNHKTKELMDTLLTSGDYQDYSEVVTCAINNLALLQTEMKERVSMVISSKESQQDSAHTIKGDDNAIAAQIEQEAIIIPKDRGVKDPLEIEKRIPMIFGFLEPTEKPDGLVTLSRDELNESQHIPAAEWFFYQ